MDWVGFQKLNRAVHIYLTMLALVLLLFFSMTGFLLNHAEWFGLDEARVTQREGKVPAEVMGDRLKLVEHLRAEEGARGRLADLEEGEEEVRLRFVLPEWKGEYVVMRGTGEMRVSETGYGVMGLLGRLHTGKEASGSWRLVMDGAAVSLFLASLTGVVLWISLPRRRKLGLWALGVSVVLVMGVYVFLR